MQCPPSSPESGPSSRLLQRRAPAPQGREPAHPKSLPAHKFSGLFSRSRGSALPFTQDPELRRPKPGVAPSEFEIASWALWTSKHFPNSASVPRGRRVSGCQVRPETSPETQGGPGPGQLEPCPAPEVAPGEVGGPSSRSPRNSASWTRPGVRPSSLRPIMVAVRWHLIVSQPYSPDSAVDPIEGVGDYHESQFTNEGETERWTDSPKAQGWSTAG